MTMTSWGLVLEGGGLRGIYSAGVLDAFFDAGIEFPYIIGVSAGAANSCSYVSRQRGRNLEILKQFHGDIRYLSLWNYITTGSLFGMDFVFRQIPYKYNIFDWKTFMESPVRFVTVCTNCKTGEAEYLEKNADMSEDDFLTILKASSSMPYAAPMVTYNGKKYLDGAIADAIPLKRAVSDGYKKNVIILTNPAGFRKKAEYHPPNGLLYFGKKNLIRALKQRVMHYNQSLEFAQAEENAGRAIIIRHSMDLQVSRIEKNKEKLIALYELGLSDAAELLKRF